MRDESIEFIEESTACFEQRVAALADQLRGSRICVVRAARAPRRAQLAYESFRRASTAMGLRLESVEYDTASDLLHEMAVRELVTADRVVKLLHGPENRTGLIHAVLESLGIAFVGHSLATDLLSQSKDLSKALMRRERIPAVPHWSFNGERSARRAYAAFRARFPRGEFVTKPNQGNASERLRVGSQATECEALVRVHPDTYLLEPYVSGQVVTVTCVSLEETVYAVPPIEYVLGAHKVMDARWKQNPLRRPAVGLAGGVGRTLMGHASRLHRAVLARGVTRSDFIVGTDGMFYCLEINTNIGMSESHDAAACFAGAGLTYEQLLWCHFGGQTREARGFGQCRMSSM